jgi:hypothetical protein
VNPNTGAIFVSKVKPPGTYFIKVVGLLPDQKTSYSDVFTINAGTDINFAPYFITPLEDLEVPLG